MYMPTLQTGISTLYMQLYETLKEDLMSDRYPAGTRMPSKRILSSHLGISVNTVDSAYQQLVSEGYIEARARSGYYASDLRSQTSGAVLQSVSVAGRNPEKKRKDILPNTHETASLSNPYRQSDAIDFSPNGVDLKALPIAGLKRTFRDVFSAYGEQLFMNCEPEGDSYLRRSLCTYLRESRGLFCDPSQIIIGAGTDYILQLLIQILRSSHEISSIAMENPVYNKAYQIFTGLQVPVDLIPLDKYGIHMQRLYQSRANLVYTTPSHQFPLGIIMPVNRRNELLTWASESEDRYIIEDDYDSEFRYSGRPIPPISAMDAAEKVIYLGTFSKSLAPSVRVSYLVLPRELCRAFHENLSYYNTTITRLDQLVWARYIETGDFERHINRMRTLYRRKRDLFLSALSPYRKKLHISGTDAGLHLLCLVKNGMSESELVASAKNAATIVYGISSYYLSDKSGQDSPDDPEKSRASGLSIPQSTVLLGYAGLSNEQVLQGVTSLVQAWKL